MSDNTKHIEVLRELRIGVEMDSAYDPQGSAKLAAIDAAIRALSPAGGGWVMVPMKMTDEMHKALGAAVIADLPAAKWWDAMLAAAPQPQGAPANGGVTAEMVERACRKYAFREDGAVWPDDYSEHEVAAERVLMREFLEHTLSEPNR